MKARLWALLTIVVMVSVFRLLPHPPGFTPVLALALFAGAHFPERRLALSIPLSAMLLSDLIIGLHSTLIFVYGAIVLIVLLGRLLRRYASSAYLVASAVFSTLLFYLITNFGAWLTLPEFYARSLAGLQTAYIAAIPFLQNNLLGTLFFTLLLFGGIRLLEQIFPVLAENRSGTQK